MTCRDLDDALLDVARGTAAGPGSVAAVESHVEYCARCAARLSRERELTAGLRALAASTASEEGSPDLGPQLMQAFAQLHPPQEATGSRTRRWIAAAAAVAVVAGAAALSVVVQREPAPVESAGQDVALAAPPVSAAPPGGNVSDAAVRTNADAAAPLSVRDSTSPSTGTPPRQGSRKSAAAGQESPSMEGFVALPTAAGLPALESGRIIRIDLPVASLPAYGVEVIPDAQRPEVEADLLVGQDGQPRAIRLVTVSSNSRSRE
jgi:hypothetical protein